jgi:hypothetical protein
MPMSSMNFTVLLSSSADPQNCRFGECSSIGPSEVSVSSTVGSLARHAQGSGIYISVLGDVTLVPPMLCYAIDHMVQCDWLMGICQLS